MALTRMRRARCQDVLHEASGPRQFNIVALDKRADEPRPPHRGWAWAHAVGVRATHDTSARVQVRETTKLRVIPFTEVTPD